MAYPSGTHHPYHTGIHQWRLARKIENVADTYAAADLYPSDYLLPKKVSNVLLSSDLSLNEIPGGMVAIFITNQTLTTALSDKL